MSRASIVFHALADNPVVLDGLELRTVFTDRDSGRFGNEFAVRQPLADVRADDVADLGRAAIGGNTPAIGGRLDQLQPGASTYLAHECPVGRQPGAATHALAAVLPRVAISGPDDAEWHGTNADVLPVDVEFFGDQHGQCRTHALADFGLVSADDNVPVRANLDEIAELAVIAAFGCYGGDADNQCAGCGRAADDECAA